MATERDPNTAQPKTTDPVMTVLREALGGLLPPEMVQTVLAESIDAFGATPGPYRVKKFLRGPLADSLTQVLGTRLAPTALRHVEGFTKAVLRNSSYRPLYQPPTASGPALSAV